ncbi:L-lactate dehydrogenase [Thermodesulfovibrionales bacterium]|nr:L-lactate dehydrogenase [Thermodesulfovibrionales bacterium]MCL0036908.1 L-lactate dehydrogenase [Thermodesulfovibrionales bacterium]MCL0041059.1 L-lactate dehydrogenase [Thermodesulfovibrionales bacterium]MCL0047398.1 L-lactate dehydrogenase [Thermodesulfovibrionales bacterium]MCL0051802.1 L-lactate dehydrogenase [Thermodesulfovibrionales bacterium]
MSAYRGSKVVIIGTGAVGATCAYALAIKGISSEIVLIDINQAKAEGTAMDLNHGLPFIRPTRIWAGDYSDCEGASIVIVTSGAAQKPGETRLSMVRTNDAIFRELIPAITKHNQECTLLIVSNPVDILTYRAWQYSGLRIEQVIGSGTALDTARFRQMLAEYFSIDSRNVHAYIVGEHGDTALPLWSTSRIGGMPIEDFRRLYKPDCTLDYLNTIFRQVKNAAYEIIKRKGATSYAIGLVLVMIVESILRDQHTIIPVSRVIEGQYGVSEVCLSLPVVLGRNYAKIIEIAMNNEEENAFRYSAETLKSVIASLPPL